MNKKEKIAYLLGKVDNIFGCSIEILSEDEYCNS